MVFDKKNTYEEQNAQAKQKKNKATLANTEYMNDEDDWVKGNLSLSKILRGDVLKVSFIRKQIKLIILIVIFIIVFISNRYSSEHEMQNIDQLQKVLTDTKYKALSSSSMLTEKCRQSKVLQMLKDNNDTTLHVSKQPPYIIILDEN